MLTLVFAVAVGALFFHAARRVREEESRSSPPSRPRRPGHPASRSLVPGWRAVATPRLQRMGLRLAAAALPGCAAVAAGGMAFGTWGLVAGTLALAAALAWAVWPEGRLLPRHPRRRGPLTEKERSDFEEIVARLSPED
ncbi:MAG: hypothetical protein ACLFWM_13205 [Actinomycetota bacterium]